MGDNEEIEDIEGTAEEETLEAGGAQKKLLGPTVIRTLIFVALALVLIIISGTIAYIVARRVGAGPETQKMSPEAIVREKPLAYFDMEPFSINTNDTDEPHFVKVTMALGYDTGGTTELQTELNKRRAQIRDIVISVIGEKRYTDLNTQEKRTELKNEVMRRVNSKLQNGEIKEIAFTEFVLT